MVRIILWRHSMVYIDPASISRLDAALCAEGGCTVDELMRRAGEAVAEDAKRLIDRKNIENPTILLLCGAGNNGGDAFAAGVSLAKEGYNLWAVEFSGRGDARENARKKYILCGNLRSEADLDDESLRALISSADLVIDGIFGAGGRGELPESVRRISRLLSESGAMVLSIDIPTGVNGANGEVSDGAITADAVSMICAAKPGLYSYPARRFCGEIFFHDIGISDEFILARFPERVRAVSEADVASLVPRRDPETHKGSFGRALLVCGSQKYRGAAALAVSGALRCGAGIVTLASDEAVAACVLAHRPEATLEPIPPLTALGDPEREALAALGDGYDALLVGCGSGKSSSLRRLIYRLLRRSGAPLVLDADAINLLAEEREESLSRIARSRRELLLTPHPAEFSRISGIPLDEIQSSRMRCASEFATKYGVNVILKGAASVVASPDGRLSINTSGSPALAHGGTGDVLAGAVTAFVAQGMSVFDSAVVAAYIHGRAGETLAEIYSENGVLAGDLPDEMARVICKILKD